jgi:hypothetical protein
MTTTTPPHSLSVAKSFRASVAEFDTHASVR